MVARCNVALEYPSALPKMGGMGRLLAILVIFAVLTPSASALADQSDKRLPSLFARLKVTKNDFEALSIENEIWGIWMESGDADVDALMERGVGAMNVGDFETALAAFNRVIEVKPKFAEGWNKRATLYYLMQRYDDSVQDIARTLELEPHHFGALSGLGLINGALGRYKVAIDAWEQALEVDPHLAGAKDRIKELRQKLQGKEL